MNNDIIISLLIKNGCLKMYNILPGEIDREKRLTRGLTCDEIVKKEYWYCLAVLVANQLERNGKISPKLTLKSIYCPDIFAWCYKNCSERSQVIKRILNKMFNPKDGSNDRFECEYWRGVCILRMIVDLDYKFKNQLAYELGKMNLENRSEEISTDKIAILLSLSNNIAFHRGIMNSSSPSRLMMFAKKVPFGIYKRVLYTGNKKMIRKYYRRRYPQKVCLIIALSLNDLSIFKMIQHITGIYSTSYIYSDDLFGLEKDICRYLGVNLEYLH